MRNNESKDQRKRENMCDRYDLIRSDPLGIEFSAEINKCHYSYLKSSSILYRIISKSKYVIFRPAILLNALSLCYKCGRLKFREAV